MAIHYCCMELTLRPNTGFVTLSRLPSPPNHGLGSLTFNDGCTNLPTTTSFLCRILRLLSHSLTLFFSDLLCSLLPFSDHAPEPGRTEVSLPQTFMSFSVMSSKARPSFPPTKKDWIKYGPLIARLYKEHTLEEVMAIMISNHGFRAT